MLCDRVMYLRSCVNNHEAGVVYSTSITRRELASGARMPTYKDSMYSSSKNHKTRKTIGTAKHFAPEISPRSCYS
jgi:hypothetical protein